MTEGSNATMPCISSTVLSLKESLITKFGMEWLVLLHHGHHNIIPTMKRKMREILASSCEGQPKASTLMSLD